MGVWIETEVSRLYLRIKTVTPCMGVWIETITGVYLNALNGQVTPCMGVWIETGITKSEASVLHVTPCMGVWIETQEEKAALQKLESHPVWVCGLKHK